MVYKFFDNKSKGSEITDKNKQNPLDLAPHQLAKKLHKPIITNS